MTKQAAIAEQVTDTRHFQRVVFSRNSVWTECTIVNIDAEEPPMVGVLLRVTGAEVPVVHCKGDLWATVPQYKRIMHIPESEDTDEHDA